MYEQGACSEQKRGVAVRLASFGDKRLGIVIDGEVLDVTDELGISEHGISPMRVVIERWSHYGPRLQGRRAPGAERGRSSPVPLSQVDLLAPVPDPTKIFAAPVNYVDHQNEMNVEHQISGLGLFLKAPSSLVGSGSTVMLPYHDRRFDQEAELAVVIGERARHVSVEHALEHVFGYTALLDITMRGGEDRSTRKSFETFTPMGPWLVTADEFGSPTGADIRCWVGAELRQDASTSDLIWGVDRLVAYASSVTTLLPGDIISTGTPAGVGPLSDGDAIEVEVEGIGDRLRVAVSAAGAVASPTSGGSTGAASAVPPGRLGPRRV